MSVCLLLGEVISFLFVLLSVCSFICPFAKSVHQGVGLFVCGSFLSRVFETLFIGHVELFRPVGKVSTSLTGVRIDTCRL